jgi:hypothetical protein
MHLLLLPRSDWATRWNTFSRNTTAILPFGFVQIGPACGPDEHTFATRIGQTANAGVAPNAVWPNTFMAAALDLPNTVESGAPAGGVHLMDKRTIAHRLALGAAGTVYEHDAASRRPELVWAGPRFKSILPLGNHSPDAANASGRWLLTFDISMPAPGTAAGRSSTTAPPPAGAALSLVGRGQAVAGFELRNGCYWGCMWVPAPVVEVRLPDQLVIETFSTTDSHASFEDHTGE